MQFFSTPFTGVAEYQNEPNNEVAQQRYQEDVARRAKEKAAALLERLRGMIRSGAAAGDRARRSALEAEAAEMAEAPGGAELLSVLGYVYIQEANMNDGSLLGIPAWFSKKNEGFHMLKSALSMTGSAAVYSSMADNPEGTGADDEALARQGLKTMWKIGKYMIEVEVRAACEQIFADKALRKDEKKALVKALKILGEVFKTTGDRVTRETMRAASAYYRQQQQQQQQRRY